MVQKDARAPRGYQMGTRGGCRVGLLISGSGTYPRVRRFQSVSLAFRLEAGDVMARSACSQRPAREINSLTLSAMG